MHLLHKNLDTHCWGKMLELFSYFQTDLDSRLKYEELKLNRTETYWFLHWILSQVWLETNELELTGLKQWKLLRNN